MSSRAPLSPFTHVPVPPLPSQPGNPSALAPQPRDWDLLLTAETHNFPCAVAPFPGACLAGRLRGCVRLVCVRLRSRSARPCQRGAAAAAAAAGAETGAGGRMRDTHATGKGSLMGAGTAGYCTGNLRMDGYVQPHEDGKFVYPGAACSGCGDASGLAAAARNRHHVPSLRSLHVRAPTDNLASPLQILIDASNGASDYGNKFGEPLIAGFCRTYGQRLANGERREWIKPIMFSGGIGQIDHRRERRGRAQEPPMHAPASLTPPAAAPPPHRRHLDKDEGEISMLVVKLGGPAYRIGMGGGAASSLASGCVGAWHGGCVQCSGGRGSARGRACGACGPPATPCAPMHSPPSCALLPPSPTAQLQQGRPGLQRRAARRR